MNTDFNAYVAARKAAELAALVLDGTYKGQGGEVLKLGKNR